MTDKLRSLVENAQMLVASGYYARDGAQAPGARLSRAFSDHSTFPIIAEVKLASPSQGRISLQSPQRLIDDYVKGGAAAISILTEPNYFGGSLQTLEMARSAGAVTLMKDIVISKEQITAALGGGASAVLLIQEVFSDLLSVRLRDELIDHAHSLGLEIVLEAGSEDRLLEVVQSEADILGINQRDLHSFEMDLAKGERLLPLASGSGRPVVVMSGIYRREQVKKIRDRGGSAVLVGGHLTSSGEPLNALRDLMVSR